MPLNLSSIDKLLNKNLKPGCEKLNKKVRRKVKVAVKTEQLKIKNDKIEEHNLVADKITSKKHKAPRDLTKKDMNGSMFRFINEKLSFSNSFETLEFFKNDPVAFEIYHKGFGNQREKWPEDPMQWVISQIRRLPRRQSAIIADFGCGDARLCKAMKDKVGKFYNYDFVSQNEDVTICDISNVPLENDSVDAVVISLALMGTNCCEYIAEANRILKIKGSLILVELVSRMEKPSKFIKNIKKMGFEKWTGDKGGDLVKKEDYFMKLHFVKLSCCDRANLPDLSLKAVMYKKR